MTTLLFVRHAVTAHTGHRLSGWLPGIPLSEVGRAQADRIAEGLAEVPLEALYSSPIDRCLETAKAIGSKKKMRPRVRDALKDTDYGDWTDRPLKPLLRTKLWRKLELFPSATRFPGGENLRETQTRVVEEIERIVDQHPHGLVCVVSHADPIRLTVAHYVGVHIDLFQRIQVAPATVTALHLSERGPYLLMLGGSPEGLVRMRR